MHQHHGSSSEHSAGGASVALVGHQNVGKSVLFQKLTGIYTVVANYPGTTVEITRGKAQQLPNTQVIDTPGVVTLPPHTDDERATAHVLLNEDLDIVLQVGDAKNLHRTLLLSTQLAEMGIPLVLALNMMDEAKAHGLIVDEKVIADAFGIKVIPTIAVPVTPPKSGTTSNKAAIFGVSLSPRAKLTAPADRK